MDFEELKNILENQFPEYKYSIGNRKLAGDCVIVKNTKYSGVDIFIKKDKILIEAAIPEMKTRLLIGAGALLFKFFSKKFNEPSKKIYSFLKNNNYPVKFRV
jgi:hypothetical protein